MKITQRMIDQSRMIAEAKVGHELQGQYRGGPWEDAAGRAVWFDDGDLEYRLKPEPRTIWVNEYPVLPGAIHDTEDDARQRASRSATRIAVEYREVVK